MGNNGNEGKQFTVASSAEELRMAARAGDVEEVQDVLKRYMEASEDLARLLPAVVGAGDRLSGNRALHLCAANGHLDIVRLLIKHSADIDATNTSGSTALHYAALNGQLEVVQELIKHNAIPVVENKFGKTALDEARLSNSGAIADFLMAHVEKTGDAPELDDEKNHSKDEESET